MPILNGGASFLNGAASHIGIPFLGREISIGDAARALDPVLEPYAPKNEIVVLVDRSQGLLARLHGNAVDAFLLKAKRSNWLVGRDIPQPNIAIRTRRGQ